MKRSSQFRQLDAARKAAGVTLELGLEQLLRLVQLLPVESELLRCLTLRSIQLALERRHLVGDDLVHRRLGLGLALGQLFTGDGSKLVRDRIVQVRTDFESRLADGSAQL